MQRQRDARSPPEENYDGDLDSPEEVAEEVSWEGRPWDATNDGIDGSRPIDEENVNEEDDEDDVVNMNENNDSTILLADFQDEQRGL